MNRLRVLLHDVEPALAELLDEWLAELGTEPLRSCSSVPDGRCHLVITAVHYPRQTDALALRQLAAAHVAPVLVLSPTFFAAIECHGPVAEALGVAGVLPQPVGREALQAAVRRLLKLPAVAVGDPS
ncbi:hypothetical protein HLB44_08400 [Aquincola sp. S2]|uniref:Response regulatory domain-containing protein n=1 Tax=Pseudaquabacterium terrae TaxID=2732868 RepID=A0ABX2EEH0_9BURK|nr:hypothetical protein [Aquabacterium terrae]NRF66999.1 hypothetical protein [Aquabacterium terrae]